MGGPVLDFEAWAFHLGRIVRRNPGLKIETWATHSIFVRVILIKKQFSGSALPPLCHPDRSAAQWRDLRFGGPFVEMFFDRGITGLRPTQGDEKGLLFGCARLQE